VGITIPWKTFSTQITGLCAQKFQFSRIGVGSKVPYFIEFSGNAGVQAHPPHFENSCSEECMLLHGMKVSSNSDWSLALELFYQVSV
jgi:hypothetical protein